MKRNLNKLYFLAFATTISFCASLKTGFPIGTLVVKHKDFSLFMA
ncbi:hypothetical protein ACFLY6_02740 [Candidatus Dependentiae bacterium]